MPESLSVYSYLFKSYGMSGREGCWDLMGTNEVEISAVHN